MYVVQGDVANDLYNETAVVSVQLQGHAYFRVHLDLVLVTGRVVVLERWGLGEGDVGVGFRLDGYEGMGFGGIKVGDN